ncbi:MAG: hypothetical protein E7575_05825 [Ruminococcaceae bacterium]|nr:hypothetical protein [Oscillospiraceae bacterium]
MTKKKLGKFFGLLAGAFVSGWIGILLISGNHLFFGAAFAFLASGLGGFAVCTIKENDTAFKVAAGIIMAIVVLFGVMLDALGDSGVRWGDLTDQEKENAKWAYEVNEYING